MSVEGRPGPDDVRTVAIIGTGVIGGGWAAHFLRMGYHVVAWDPGTDAAERLSALLDMAWPSLERLGLRDGASRSRVRFAGTLDEALAEADFVQESSPEVLAAKVALLGAIDSGTRPGVVVASSTSGFGMSDMAVDCATPGRFVVGHPFNPPYLIPLVEVVGGSATEPATVAWAEAFYTVAGKVCLTLDHEVPGFVGNRLQEALWREALHMIDSGQATVEQVDDSIVHGPGLRWALMGPILTFHLAGGPGWHGAHAGPLRPGAARAVDPAGGAAVDGRAARPPGLGCGQGGRRADRYGARAAPRRVPRRPAAPAGQIPGPP